MTISTPAFSLKNNMDKANPNQIADAFRLLKVGSILRRLPTALRAKAPVAAGSNPYVAAAAQSIQLPDDAKAAFIFAAYARTGTGTAGPLTVVAPGSLGAGNIALAPSGDLLFLAADAWTNVDVLYLPEQVDTIELILPVASNAAALPTGAGQQAAGGAVVLMEAESLTGTSVRKMIVDAPGTSVSASHAALDLAKANVKFASADAITSARVKIGIVPAINLDTLLETAMGTPGTLLSNVGIYLPFGPSSLLFTP